MPGTRFTTWLAEDEVATLSAIAEASDTSRNFIVRIALRAVLFDKPIPGWLRGAAQEIADERKRQGVAP